MAALLLWVHQPMTIGLGDSSAADIFFGVDVERVMVKQIQVLVFERWTTFEVVGMTEVAGVVMASIRIVIVGLVTLQI